MAPLTVEDRLIIKTLPIEKGWAVNRMIAEFTARQRKWHTTQSKISHNWFLDEKTFTVETSRLLTAKTITYMPM